MLPDTGADVTAIGICHLELLQIPRTSLQSLHATTTLTPDGFQMSPALGWFQASLKLGRFRAASLKKMVGRPVKIHPKDDDVHYAIHMPQPIPFIFWNHVKEELDLMVKQWTINASCDLPSAWYHSIVLIAKSNGVSDHSGHD
ncbi:hypothetical protein SK128_010235 [Halocaridina rubra]|uniref:Peptidase A2 domain-containing protein n=1 Tax=Halocaridina rubra TaxID=373956 RepID=A0AAN8WHY9_HALRR